MPLYRLRISTHVLTKRRVHSYLATDFRIYYFIDIRKCKGWSEGGQLQSTEYRNWNKNFERNDTLNEGKTKRKLNKDRDQGNKEQVKWSLCDHRGKYQYKHIHINFHIQAQSLTYWRSLHQEQTVFNLDLYDIHCNSGSPLHCRCSDHRDIETTQPILLFIWQICSG